MYSLAAAGLLAASTLLTTALAGAIVPRVSRTTPGTNIAVYYGQGANQTRMRDFCNDDTIDIFPIGFVTALPDQTADHFPVLNFGNQCGGNWTDPTTGKSTGMLDNCHQMIDDISYCQSRGKKVLLSIGGERYVKIASQDSAVRLAKYLWQAFGTPDQNGYSGARPFGNIVIDGFDFDIEQAPDTDRSLWGTLASELRSNAAINGHQIILSAAPQCVVPDLGANTGDVMGPAIHMASFDFIWIQFYNTRSCSARAHFDHNYGGPGSDISLDSWVSWLQSNSFNKDVKVFIGLPGSKSASNDAGMYLTPAPAQSLIQEFGTKYASNFGGLMLWEATYSDKNRIGNNESYAMVMRDILKRLWPSVTSTTTFSTTTTLATISGTISTTTTTTEYTSSSMQSSVATSTTSSPTSSKNSTIVSTMSSYTISSLTFSGGITTSNSSQSSSTAFASPITTSRSQSITTSRQTVYTSVSSTVTHPNMSSTSTSSSRWGNWNKTTSSTVTSIPMDPTTTASFDTAWKIWPTTSSSTSTPAVTISPDVTVTIVTTSFTSVCPTGFTVIPFTTTLTLHATDPTKSSSKEGAFTWPTDPNGIPSGFVTSLTLCPTGCGPRPTTVTLTVPSQHAVSTRTSSSTQTKATAATTATSTSTSSTLNHQNAGSKTSSHSSSSVTTRSSDPVAHSFTPVAEGMAIATSKVEAIATSTRAPVPMIAPWSTAGGRDGVKTYTGAASGPSRHGGLVGGVVGLVAGVLLMLV